jgi:hypothetical protein
LVIFRCKIRIQHLIFIFHFHIEHQSQPGNGISDFEHEEVFRINGLPFDIAKRVRGFVFYSDDGDRYRSFFILNPLAESEVNDGKIEL